MLSIKHNFLFIHLPKTGGNSIQSVLHRYSEDNIVCLNELQDGVERFEIRNNFPSIHKHSRLIDYQAVLDPDLFKRLYKFTTIRNPWERLISFYFSPHRRTTEWRRDEFIKLIETIKPLKEMLILHNQHGEFWGNVDTILRFENLSEDFEALCKKLELPTEPLPKRNQSLVKEKNYRQFYDQELVSMVHDRFNDEVVFGNYTFN